MKNIFDSHAHYTAGAFDPDRDALLESLPARGISGVMLASADIGDASFALRLAQQYDYIFSSAGVHPQAVLSLEEGWLEEIAALVVLPKVKAIGEIGLDYHYPNTNKALQQQVFEMQLQLAAELNMPVIVHSREAFADTLMLLKKYRPAGVLHCFSGSAEAAGEILALGMYIGFTGVITFKNAKKALLALERVPRDRLLLETDCPYMAPEPLRGQRSDSTMLVYTAQAAASIKRTGAQEILDDTCENARRIYGI